MFCPNCGTKSSTEQKFCRSCGFGLEKIAEVFSEQLPAKTVTGVELQKRKKLFEKIGFAALSTCGVGAISFLLYAVVYRMMIVDGKIGLGFMILGFLTLVVCALAGVFLLNYADELEKSTKSSQNPETNTLSGSNTTNLLEEKTFVPASVTEHTTDLLYIERRKITDELG